VSGDNVAYEKAEKARQARVKRLELQEALWTLDTLGLAPLKRLASTQPDGFGPEWSRWLAELRAAEEKAVSDLTARGARIVKAGELTEFRFAKIAAVSSSGVGQAMRNWAKKVHKRLAMGAAQ